MRESLELAEEIRYEGGSRYVRELQELAWREGALPWKDGGVYLISGGAGGIGRALAAEIVKGVRDAHVILAGRSELSTAQSAQLVGIGAGIEYCRLDVCDEQAVQECVAEIVGRYGALDGVVHAAGVVKDGYVLRKGREEFAQVLAPKVRGVVNLDRATAHLALDLFVLCASWAGVFGNEGQGDYALANAFLDCYAEHRAQQVRAGDRRGRTVSIAWPLWAGGGMQAGEQQLRGMRERGLEALPSQEAMRALYAALDSAGSQVTVRYGQGVSQPEARPPHEVQPSESPLLERTLERLKGLFSEVTRLAVSRLDAHEGLSSYGIDSILITQLNRSWRALSPVCRRRCSSSTAVLPRWRSTWSSSMGRAA